MSYFHKWTSTQSDSHSHSPNGLAGLNVLAGLFLVTTLWAATPALAEEFNDGILDEPAPTTNLPNRGQAAQVHQQHQGNVRGEAKGLRKLPPGQLKQRAKRGERLAQLVLAESLAKESQTWVDVPLVANDAMAEAAYWVSLAARRGYPGAASIEGALPALPLRVNRNQ